MGNKTQKPRITWYLQYPLPDWVDQRKFNEGLQQQESVAAANKKSLSRLDGL